MIGRSLWPFLRLCPVAAVTPCLLTGVFLRFLLADAASRARNSVENTSVSPSPLACNVPRSLLLIFNPFLPLSSSRTLPLLTFHSYHSSPLMPSHAPAAFTTHIFLRFRNLHIATASVFTIIFPSFSPPPPPLPRDPAVTHGRPIGDPQVSH